MCAAGFTRSKQCPQFFFHKEKEILSLVHGEDFFSKAQTAADHDWLANVFREHF